MSKGNIFENDLLGLILNAVPITGIASNAASSPLTNLYLSLHTADVGEDGTQTTSEAGYTGYARVAVARDGSGWTITGNSAALAAVANFPPATGGTATVTHFALGTSASGAGKVFYKGLVSPNIAVADGVTPQLNTGTTITED